MVSASNRISTELGSMLESILLLSDTTSVGRKITEADFVRTEQNLQQLQKRLATNPAQVLNQKRLSRSSKKFIADARSLLEVFASPDPLVHQTHDVLALKLMVSYERILEVINDTVAVEKQSASDDGEKEKARLLVRIWMIVSVSITVVSAVALAHYSAVAIRIPIEAIAKNAARISKRETLVGSRKTNDELGNLDCLLHRVNDSIEEALNHERNLINFAADLVFSVDRSGVFRNVNPFAKTMLGIEAQDLINAPVFSVIADDDREKATKILNTHLPNGKATISEIRMKNQGNVVETAWSIIWSPLDQTNFCVAHDVTERKQIERLKQEFIAMLSHDLRTPLRSVLSSINHIQAGATGEVLPPVSAELAHVEHNIDYLIKLVDELLDFEKLEAGTMDYDFRLISTGDVLAESLGLIQALSDSRRVKISATPETTVVFADQRKLIQVLVNLLSNALKHSPEDTKIQLKIRLLDNMTEISVHDEGPGVPEELAEKIFAPFEQISDRASASMGTGLGLAICKRIIEGHHGQIGVRGSEILSGSAFWFTVPVRES